MQPLIETLREPFMIRALVAAVLVGSTCAVLGVYVVLRQMAFIGDWGRRFVTASPETKVVG